MVDNVEINGPRAMAVDTLTTVLEPLLKNYEGQLKLVENTQKSLNTKLQSVLTGTYILNDGRIRKSYCGKRNLKAQCVVCGHIPFHDTSTFSSVNHKPQIKKCGVKNVNYHVNFIHTNYSIPLFCSVHHLPSQFIELASVQSTAPVNTVSSNSSSESSSSALNSTIIGPYVKKIELLRKRLDSVSYTMNRVQVRIESLQDAVTRSESAARRQQQQQAAILAAKAASILPSSTTGAE